MSAYVLEDVIVNMGGWVDKVRTCLMSTREVVSP